MMTNTMTTGMTTLTQKIASALCLTACLVGAELSTQVSAQTNPPPLTYCGQIPTIANATTAASFIANASNERLEIRSGRINAADWEWGLGINTQSAGQFQNINNINWVSGVAIKYTLTYNADGSGTIVLFDSSTNNQLATKAFPIPASPATGLRAGNAIKVYVKTNAGLTTATTATSIQSVNGQAIDAANQAAYTVAAGGNNVFADATLIIALPDPASTLASPTLPATTALTVTGTATLTWPGAASAIPTGSRLNATITAGNISCSTGSGPQAQTITNIVSNPVSPLIFAPAPNNTVTLSATGGASGNPVTFASTTPTVCTTSGTNTNSSTAVTILAAGTCTITADQAGSTTTTPTYSAAPQVSTSITISKANQTITGLAITPASPFIYAPAPNPNNTFTLSAIAGASTSPVTYASTTPLVCTVMGNTASVITAGICTITADQAGDSNYHPATQATVNVTINKATQTITNFISTQPSPINQAVSTTFSVTAQGGASANPVIFSSSTPSVCSVSGTNNTTTSATITIQAAGTCTLSATQLGNDNYLAATSATLTLTITTPAQLYYIHPDHLGTPRVITKATDNTKVWEWKSEDAFGNNLPDENPNAVNGTTPFQYNLRFPGQYFDVETGTYYNYFRDYDPQTGRYVQSDPIGLAGGINTFAYVGGNPVAFFDPFGLEPVIPNPNGAVPGGPWTPHDANRPGQFLGPKPSDGLGGRPQCQWVPPDARSGSQGYWKINEPGRSGWQRYNVQGKPITPEQAHPGTRPANSGVVSAPPAGGIVAVTALAGILALITPGNVAQCKSGCECGEMCSKPPPSGK
jgi:RHS repeat-associated protein